MTSRDDEGRDSHSSSGAPRPLTTGALTDGQRHPHARVTVTAPRGLCLAATGTLGRFSHGHRTPWPPHAPPPPTDDRAEGSFGPGRALPDEPWGRVDAADRAAVDTPRRLPGLQGHDRALDSGPAVRGRCVTGSARGSGLMSNCCASLPKTWARRDVLLRCLGF